MDVFQLLIEPRAEQQGGAVGPSQQVALGNSKLESRASLQLQLQDSIPPSNKESPHVPPADAFSHKEHRQAVPNIESITT